MKYLRDNTKLPDYKPGDRPQSVMVELAPHEFISEEAQSKLNLRR